MTFKLSACSQHWQPESASHGKSGDRGISYKVIYSSTTLVDLYIQLPDFPRFAGGLTPGSLGCQPSSTYPEVGDGLDTSQETRKPCRP